MPFFIGVELIHKSSWSHPFDELPFFYYKRVIAAIYSFKFTAILTIIIIPPWFQACIYWKKFVSWRHHFQPSIFSMIVSSFHGSTWRNPHLKETVFISQHFLQPSIIISGLWSVDSRKSWRVCLFKENHCGPALLKMPIYATELVAISVLKNIVLNAQKHLQRSYSFIVNQHSEISFPFSKILKHSAVFKG